MDLDIFLKKRLNNTLPTFTEAEIIKITTDRVELMHLLHEVLKTERDADPYSMNFRTALNTHLERTKNTELMYLVGENQQKHLDHGQSEKVYLSWTTLMTISVVKQKRRDWVKEHERYLLAVFMSRFPDNRLMEKWFKITKKTAYATAEEIEQSEGFLDPAEFYVKVHYSDIIPDLTVDEDGDFHFIRDGYFYIPFKRNMRKLFVCIIEEIWLKNWDAMFQNLTDLRNKYRQGNIMMEIEKSLSKKRFVLKIPTLHQLPFTANSDLPEIAREYFPPCMTTMMSAFQTNGELKHHARKQFTLFLKDIDVPKTVIIDLYNTNYSRPHLMEKKDKVLYYMRHLLGMTYSRRPYYSYNCSQIQEHTDPDGRFEHGCYFKKTTPDQMTLDMKALSFPPEKIQSICGAAKGYDGFNAACLLHLQTKFKLKVVPNGMEKPNDYYRLARCAKNGGISDIEDLVAGN